MRAFRSTLEEEEKWYAIRPTLRTNRPAANYARQSNPYANKKKSESREMQTVDIIKWCVEQGWTEDLLDPYYADLGLSGTLRPDKRPDMLRLFDNIDQGIYDGGTVVCYQESRLFRDETAIYYNQFIQKCLEHDIVVVVISPYVMIYDFRDEFLKEMFRYKCKEAAEFIPRHVKGWLHPARLRAALRGEWAGLGDVPVGLIVDTDPTSPTYKRHRPYHQHGDIIRERLFQRFMELGGDFGLLHREVRKSPVILPPFGSDVEEWQVKRFKVKVHPGGGYVIDNKNILRSILTNPKYIGYRPVNGYIPRDGQGNKIKAHESIVPEELFYFAYNRLAKTDLDGNPIEGRKMRRYYQKPAGAEYGLLKFRITSSTGRVRTSLMSEFNPKSPSHGASYYIEPERIPAPGGWASVPCDEVDSIVARRLLWHVREFNEKQGNVAEYEELAKSRQRERKKQAKQIDHSIQDVEERQVVLTTRLGRTKSARAQELIEREIDRLEKERSDLIEAKRVLEDEAQNDIGSLDDELRELEACWPEYPFEKRRALINFLVQEVVIDKVSTHWMRVQVLWLHPDWGAEEMYHLRLHGKHTDWTEEEDTLIRELYTSLTKPELMRLLPERTWLSIRHRGVKFNLVGRKRGPRIYEETGDPIDHLFASVARVDPLFAYNDLAFMLEHGIPLNVQDTNWAAVSQPSYLRMVQSSSSHRTRNWRSNLVLKRKLRTSFMI